MITIALPDELRDVRCHGDFYTHGAMEVAAPNLQVDGVGLLSLPFQQSQLESLIAGASLAPFGRGAQTLVDVAVRKTWQIDAAHLHFGGRHWQRSLDAIVAEASAGLGVSGPVTAQLYKLLVYDTGSFFVGHRDTEKAAGMFATLVIVLPSVYQGGELLIRHHGREVCLNLADTELTDAAFAAFYADCVHEVRPVTQGTRLTLVYNLLREGSAVAAPPRYPEQQAALASLLGRWAASEPQVPAWPRKLVYLLEHAYSPAELAFETLKNADAARAQVLAAAAAQAGCEIHVAQLEIAESGSAEYDGHRWRRAASQMGIDDDDFEILDVVERDASLSGWRAPGGSAPLFGNQPLLDEELCPPDALDDARADERHFHEATGNEGASFERRYLRAALVLWPRAARLAVINQGGPESTLPLLEETVHLWHEAGADSNSATLDEARALASLMLDDWPADAGHPEAEAARLLDCLACIDDRDLIARLLGRLAAGSAYAGAENARLVRAALCLPKTQAIGLIEQIVAAHAQFVPAACADLLERCARQRVAAPVLLAPAAQRLVDLLPRALGPREAGAPWRKVERLDAVLVVNLLGAMHGLGLEPLGQRALEQVLATADADAVLVGAALALDAPLRQFAPAARLGALALSHLRARIAQVLEAPRDYRRGSVLDCHCEDCARLARFLDDPAASDWTFRAAQARRRHVEQAILRNRCDLDRMTVRSGNPHGLLCTKNQASHERRVRQRTEDLLHARRLAWADRTE